MKREQTAGQTYGSLRKKINRQLRKGVLPSTRQTAELSEVRKVACRQPNPDFIEENQRHAAAINLLNARGWSYW